jgi:acetyl esterase/lipase
VSLIRRIAFSTLSRPARHSYGTDVSQVADLHVPRGDGPFPVAVLMHGGYWSTRYGKLVTRPLALDLVRRGWAAWNLEYRRLGHGRGGGGGWPATFDDVAAGIDALETLRDPRLDLTRVTAVGHSAGGQLALWAAARPDLPADAPGASPAVVLTHVAALTAVTNLAAAGAMPRTLMGGTPEEVPDRYAQADPIRRLPLEIPVLLVHPRDDATVSVLQSRRYADAARAQGADVTLVEPATGGHTAPIDPSSEAWEATATWLRGVATRLPSPAETADRAAE